jgi:eukaryotic-like serine/threonine-protein kinase
MNGTTPSDPERPPAQGDAAPSWGGETLDLDATAVGPAAPPPDLAGRRLGRFLLVERLGRGKQAVIWKAFQLQPCARLVALKVFALEWPLRRLWRVAQLRTAALEGGPLAGTAVLPLYEYGEVGGYLYFAMPVVAGPSLSEVLHQRRQSGATSVDGRHRLADRPGSDYLREVVGILARIARGLGALHDAGAVHCDVKPGNILLDGDGSAYLCDFGLARHRDDAPPPAPGLTTTGTPIYMAREKLVGGRAVDERLCDVYSLGVTLYEALTQHRPFHVPDDLPRSDWSAYLSAATAPRPGAVRPGLPAALEAIVLRAMARDPAHRYPSAWALADDLERSLAGAVVPLLAPPDGSVTMGRSVGLPLLGRGDRTS